MKVNNIPRHFDTDEVERIYSEKDGVPVKYVATTALDHGTGGSVKDIFYRETPHPEFGNRYFSLNTRGSVSWIGDADVIEDLEFGMIENDNGELEYSRHRHDYVSYKGNAIDGGRAYVRGNGFKVFKMKDGEFVDDNQ